MQKNKRPTAKTILLRFGLFLLLTIAGGWVALSTMGFTAPAKAAPALKPAIVPIELYCKLDLSGLGLSETAFNLAVKGWEKLKAKGEVSKNIVSICDFTQSSKNKRLYVIDLASGELLFNTLVAHGKNTG